MKKLLSTLLACSMVITFAACGSDAKPSSDNAASISEVPFVINEDPVVVNPTETDNEDSTSAAKVDPNFIPENSYRSELTNEWISNDIKDQRPIAVMVDNESLALPHYGTSDADIVYEMMNSTANDRITRFMVIVKDWQNIERLGNIRSTRSTNCFTFPEYNAILVHDGGPYYINEWLAYKNAKDHLSGGFARIDRDRGGTYEEYVTAEDYKGVGEYAGNSYDGLKTRIKAANFDTEYNDYYKGKHFTFSDTEISLKDEKDAKAVKAIALPYGHNKSKLDYDEASGTYVYSEYGEKYVDALYDDGRGLNFKNVIIQIADFVQFDDHGYMCFYGIGGGEGYYITDGYCIPVKWEKPDQPEITKFYNKATGEEITLNTGKTYITICPLDVSDDIIFK